MVTSDTGIDPPYVLGGKIRPNNRQTKPSAEGTASSVSLCGIQQWMQEYGMSTTASCSRRLVAD